MGSKSICRRRRSRSGTAAWCASTPSPSRRALVRSPLVGRADQLATLREIVGARDRLPGAAARHDRRQPGHRQDAADQRADHGARRGPAAAVPRVPRRRRARRRGQAGAARGAGVAAPRSLRADAEPRRGARLRFAHEIRTVMASDQVAEMLHFLGTFVGLEFPPTPFLRAVTENPQAAPARSRARRCAGSSSSTPAQAPLVLVLDDMQWADRRDARARQRPRRGARAARRSCC